jgi:hypothetical protein
VGDAAGGLELLAAAWDADGERLVVAAAAAPSRSPRAGPEPPRAWIELIDGRSRAVLRRLWAGGGMPPRHVALEGGTVAASADMSAHVWTDAGELAPDAGIVDGLALADGGRLLAVAGRDGRLTLWPAPRFDAATEPAADATGPVAAAAAAPVIAWAGEEHTAVCADGAVARVPVTARALALDAGGGRLAILDAERTLHRFAIAR